jgi:CheY-like chemotaxis protein
MLLSMARRSRPALLEPRPAAAAADGGRRTHRNLSGDAGVGRPSAEPGAPAVPSAEPERDAGRTTVVLLAEDDPEVLHVGRRTLERAGYTVLAASNGWQALRESDAWPARIDVLVTDLDMPTIRGTELIDYVRRSRPDVAVLLTSGLLDETGAQLVEGGQVAYLAKPYTREALTNAVAAAFDGLRSPDPG